MLVASRFGFRKAGPVAPPATSIIFRASASSVGNTLTLPASIQSGDLIVILNGARNSASSDPSLVVPNGFTAQINSAASLLARYSVLTKIADGSEASSVLTLMDGTANEGAVCFVFYFDGAASPVISGVVSTQTAGTPSNQTVNATTPSDKARLSLGFVGALDDTVSGSGFTDYYDHISNSAITLRAYYVIYAAGAGGSSNVASMGDRGGCNFVGGMKVNL